MIQIKSVKVHTHSGEQLRIVGIAPVSADRYDQWKLRDRRYPRSPQETFEGCRPFKYVKPSNALRNIHIGAIGKFNRFPATGGRMFPDQGSYIRQYAFPGNGRQSGDNAH